MTTELTADQKDLLAKVNYKVVELICKELGMKVIDMIVLYNREAGFIVAALQSIIVQNDLKNESDLNALENQSPEQ